MMLILYKRMTEKELLKAAAEATTQIQDWFDANPKRKVCRAELMYGRLLTVKKGQVTADIQAFTKALIAEDKAKTPAKKAKKTAANYGQDDGRNTTPEDRLLPR